MLKSVVRPSLTWQGGIKMPGMVKDLSVEEFRTVVRETVEQAMRDMLEDIQALSSESFLHSIEEAREDYREGRVTALADLLDG